jgi:hypothetical protein
MSTRIALVCIGCKSNDVNGNIDLAQNVHDNGMYSTEGAVLYPNPGTSKINFKKQLDLDAAAEALVKAGGSTHDTDDRDTQNDLLHGMHASNVNYANQLFRGNKVNLGLSGYPFVSDPTPHGVPEPPVCRKVTNGKLPGTVKFYLAKTTSPLLKKKDTYMYYLYVTDVPNDTSNLKCILHTRDSRKIIATNVERGKDLFYYITCENSAGESESTSSIKYMKN